jgi:hypothetical protein
MKGFIFAIIIMVGALPLMAQDLSSTELLDKAIAYHDPNQLWDVFEGKLFITLKYPDGKERQSEVEINLPKEYFKLTTLQDDDVIEYILEKEDCTVRLNGETSISDEDRDTYLLSCDQALKMKNYYTYLYGLPMKLKDPGSQLDPLVQTKNLNGKNYLVLKVTYDEGIGNDIWYFYFNPLTYAMEAYQFFHDETKNDGEYIILSEIENVASIKMPKIRTWYLNSNDKLLGTDILTKAGPLQ